MMKCLLVLATICIVTLCRCEGSSDLHVLDISNADGSKVTIDEGTEDGVSYKSFVPKANKNLDEVKDGDKVLWKASSEKEKCTLADSYNGAGCGLIKLRIRNESTTASLYFKRVGEEWESTKEDDFNDLLEGMNAGENDVKENVEGEANDAKENIEGKANDSTAEELFSLPDLQDGDLHDEIVSPEEHDGGPHDVVLESIGSPTELPTEHILQSPTTPIRLTPQEVVSAQEVPGTPIQAVQSTIKVILDVANPDPSRISSTSNTSDDMESKVFYPKDNISIVCIMDSGMPIWAVSGILCTEAHLFSKPGFPLLLKIHTSAEGTNACVSYEKGLEGWTRVKEDFDGKLEAMKNGKVRNVDVQNVESVPNPRIGTPSVNPQGSHSGGYPVSTPTITSPPLKDFVDEPVAQHTTGTILKPEPVHPTAPPMPEENLRALPPVSAETAPPMATPQQEVDHTGVKESEVHMNYQLLRENLQDLIPATPTPPMAEEDVHAQHVPQMAQTPSAGVSPPMATQHSVGGVAMAPPQANPPATPIPQMQTMSPVPTQGHPMNTPTQHPTGTALRQDWVHSTGGTQTAQDQAIQRNFQQMPQENVRMIHPAQLGFQVAMDPQGSPLHARGNTPTVISPPPKDFVDKPMAQHPMGTARPEQVHPPSGAGGMPEHMPPMEIPQMMQRPVQTIPPGHGNPQTVPTPHMDVLRVQGVPPMAPQLTMGPHQATQHSAGNLSGAQEPAMQANPMQITNQVTAPPPQAFPQKPVGQPVGQQPAMQAIPQVATTPPHINPPTQAMPMQVTPQMIVIPVQANPQLQAVTHNGHVLERQQAVQMVNQHSATLVRGQELMLSMETQHTTGNVSRRPEHAQIPQAVQAIPPVQGASTVQHPTGNVAMASGPVQGAPMNTHLRVQGPVQAIPQIQTVTHTGVIQGRQEPTPTMQTVTLVATANPTQGIPPRQVVPQAVQTQGHPMNVTTQHPVGNVLRTQEPTLQVQLNPQVMKPQVQVNPQIQTLLYQDTMPQVATALTQGIPQVLVLPMQNGSYAQVTPQVGNILVLPQQVPLMNAVSLLPTPMTTLPTVDLQKTHAPPRNVEVGYNKPREIMNKPKDATTLTKTVDLTERGSLSTAVYEVVEDGVTNKSYFPNNQSFDKVMDGDKPLWTARVGEECTMIWMCSKEGHSSILTLSVKNVNEKTPKPLYLEKVGKEWSGITEANFKAKRELMRVKNG